MKIVIVNGSVKKGATYESLKHIEKTLTAHGNYEFEYIHMKDLEIGFCKSCFRCFMEGEETCYQNDKINIYKEMLLNADGIILSSPVYAMNISGAMKNFIDSLTFLFHRPELFHKKGMAVVTTMGSHGKKNANYLKKVLSAFGVKDSLELNITLFGRSISNEKILKKIEKSALKYHKLLQSQTKSPTIKDLLWFSMWKANTQIEHATDYEFWKSKGWYESDYYYPIKINIIKKLIGRLAYKFLTTVMPTKS